MERVVEFLLINSFYALIVLAVVLLMRLTLRRAPRVFSYMLWAVVFLRLLCPLSFSSELSIIPDFSQLASGGTHESAAYGNDDGIGFGQKNAAAQIAEPKAAAADSVVPEITGGASVSADTGTGFDLSSILFIVWLCGTITVLAWYVISWLRLNGKVSTATLVEQNIYESDRIGTAFVHGIIKPKIYIPCRLDGDCYRCIVCHERTHIRRGDHIVKLLTYIIAAVYWFNPVVWASMYLMCRDMEQACDEAVVASMGTGIKGDYSRMLLNFSISRPIILGTAFGQNHARKRIKNVLSYKKPTGICIALSVAAVLFAAAACAGSNHTSEAQPELPNEDAVVSDSQISPSDLPEEVISDTAAEPEPDDNTADYDIPELGEPQVIMTTTLERGSHINATAKIEDHILYVDMGNGKIVPYSSDLVTAGETIKLYSEGAILWLFVNDNELSSLDISNCPSLTMLYCNDNNLTEMDTSHNPALETFNCKNNQISALDMSACPKLVNLGCTGNNISELNISANFALTELYCAYNQLTELDVSNNRALTILTCNANQLDELDISNNTALETLYCQRNNFDETKIALD